MINIDILSKLKVCVTSDYLRSQLRPVVDTRSGDWVWILWMVMFSASFFNMNIIAIRWIDYSEWFWASDISHPPGITANVGLCIASFKVSFSLQSETGPEIFINLWFFEFLIRGKRGSRDPLEVLATNFLSWSDFQNEIQKLLMYWYMF